MTESREKQQTKACAMLALDLRYM